MCRFRFICLSGCNKQPEKLSFKSLQFFGGHLTAAKGAVEGLVRSLAAELSPTIRVNGIAPSLTDTPLAENLLNSEAKRQASADRHPLKRVGDPAETARVVDALLGPAIGFMTGQILKIDGGLSSVKLLS